MTTGAELNRNKPFAEIRGMLGVAYQQDGNYFDTQDKGVTVKDGKRVSDTVPAEPVVEPKAEAPQAAPTPEFNGTVESLQDFDDYAEFLDGIDPKAAKRSIKEFANDTLGLKMSGNRKLETFIEETRAEFKAMLESGIE